MALLFGRKIVVETDDLIITDPKIRIDIKTSLSSNPNDGSIEIYNLSPNRRRNIKERGGLIRVSAGYGSTVPLIAEQTIQEVTNRREKLSRITKISMGGQITRASLLGGVTNLVYRGTVNIRTIATNIITSDLGFQVGNIEALPDFTYTDWGWSGPSSEGLKNLLLELDVNAYEENGVVYFNRISQLNSEAPTLRITPKTGLLDVPEETDEGANIRTLLSPLARPGTLVELESDDLSGSWKCISVHHVGTNWTPGPFETEMELRPYVDRTSLAAARGGVGFGD